MLEPVRLADQWNRIESELPVEWADVRLNVEISDPARATRVAALLASANPGRRGDSVVLRVSRLGGTSPHAARRLLERLDREGVGGRVELLDVQESEAVLGPPRAAASLAGGWDRIVQRLPDDWSDLLCEVELDSSDHIAPAALELAPVNPSRYGKTRSLRFRVARVAGYGASPAMTRRCLERLDEDGIRGHVRVLRALSETDHVRTQGPVWYVEGRAV